MDPSKRDDRPSLTPSATSSKAPTPPPRPPSTSDASSTWSTRLNNPSMIATPVPVSPSGLSSSSLLSPADAPPRSAAHQAHSTPRRISSSSSLRDESRQSTPSLKKRSSTASLRSIHRGGSTSPRLSSSRRSSSSTFATSPTTATTMNNPNNHATSRKSPSHAPADLSIPTAASIAAEHFQKEVDLHQSTHLQSQTLVVVHDDCYGHRFSRPRSSKAALNSIVERPERIQASVLGVSAAYVRLARRYAGGRFVPHPDLDLNRMPVPPFQIRKTARAMSLSSPAVTHVHGSKWMDDLKSMCDAAESRLALNGKELIRPRSSGKDNAADNGPALHEGDLYLCSESLNALQGALGGVCEGVDAVLGQGTTKRVFVCIRPPGHHCSSGHPSGFCWINNVHVGISYAAMTHGLTHAAILDFDLHHGDGSQEITWEQNQKAMTAPRNAASYKKTTIGYFSLHDINSYPCEGGDFEKVRNASACIDKAHGQSIWNVHLEPWKTDMEFWELYGAKYVILIEKARAFLRQHTERLASTPNGPPPKAAIFISAGFDASEWEGAGMQRHKVNVPTDFYAKFTADVVRMADEEGLGVDGRVISVLEGGYSNRALTSGVLSHLSGLGDVTLDSLGVGDQQVDRLATEMTDRLGLFDSAPASFQHSSPEAAYDSEWWSPAVLEELETLVYPPPAPCKPRGKAAPTYFAPTQSFTAKVVPSSRDRKSTGSQISVEQEAPPLPSVDWATATHELSKILIPSDRQTTSCRPEELNAGASRLRRERQTTTDSTGTSSAAPEESRMKLRVRKPKSSLPSTPTAETPKRQAVKSNRRTTIDPASDLPDSSLKSSPSVRGTRRKSAASTTTPSAGPDAEQLGGTSQRSPSRAASIAEGDIRPGTATGARKASGSRPGATPKRSSHKKAPPVPQVPSAFLSSASTGEERSSMPAESRPISASPEGRQPQDDIDSLAAGVRKLNIKLKVPSPEEHAAREKKAAQERKKRSTKPPKKLPGTKVTAHPPGKLSSRSVSAPNTSQIGPVPTSARAGIEQGVKTEDARASGSSSIVTPETSSPIAPTTGTNGFGTAKPPVQHGPNSTQALRSISSQMVSPPLTPGDRQDAVRPHAALYSPPASATLDKTGLPVFTSNSPIPFSPANARSSKNQAPESMESVFARDKGDHLEK